MKNKKYIKMINKILFLTTVVSFLSCTSKSIETTQIENYIINSAEINTIPLVEMHCHLDLSVKKIPGQMHQLIELQKQENLKYVLWLSKNYDLVIKEARANNSFAGAVLWLHPKKENWEQLDSIISANKDVVKGLKLHPTSDSYDVEFELIEPVFSLANKHDILVVTHTDTIRSHAGKFRPLLKKYPETKCILYHVAPMQDACQLVNEFENVYLDVSFTAWGRDFQQKVLQQVGKEKILFGIDSPLGFPKDSTGLLPHYRNAAKEVAAFYDFDREIVEHIFYRNAEQLLGIN